MAQIHVPAMRGKMGSRTYYSCLMPMDSIQNLFKFDPEERQWTDLSPEQREQRTLNKSRVPVLTSYIVDNEYDYLFASITASYKTDPVFIPMDNALGEDNIGILKLKLGDELTINDGQHRCAGIVEAVKKESGIGQSDDLRTAVPMGEHDASPADVHGLEPTRRQDLQIA